MLSESRVEDKIYLDKVYKVSMSFPDRWFHWTVLSLCKMTLEPRSNTPELKATEIGWICEIKKF